MQTTIDSAGRIVIPKLLRERFGLRGGTAITIDDAGDHVEVRPAGATPQLVEREGRLVFTADADVPALTDNDVRRLVEENRR